MSQKIAKLIRKYVDVIQSKDYRIHGTKSRPDFVIRQKMTNMNSNERIKFISIMKEEIKKYE